MAGGLGYRVPVLDRFWAKVDKGDPEQCWEWRGMLAHGYGYLWVEDKMVRAHRLAYSLFVGEIPADAVVMHSCDNRACVNPAHLQAGSAEDNMRDCVAKGRHGNQWRRQLVGHRGGVRAEMNNEMEA